MSAIQSTPELYAPGAPPVASAEQLLAEANRIIAEQNGVIAGAYAALLNVRRLISDAAMTGFNWKDGDWADRLFASQVTTTAAIAKIEGRS